MGRPQRPDRLPAGRGAARARAARPLRPRLRRAGLGRADGLLRALDARRDRGHPGRRLRVHRAHGGRRRRRCAGALPRHRDREGRRADRRLDRHGSAGARPDQRDLRRDGGRDLQRGLPSHRPPHPEELGRLPADPHHRAARLGGERRLSGPVGRRQHRDAPEAGRHGDRRARARAARSRRRRGGRDGLQLPLRRGAPEDRRLLRELPPRGRRLGRQVLRRRQRRDHRQERQLPEHAGGDLRDALPAARGRVLADRGLRRRRAACAAGSGRAGSCASRRARR